MSSARLAPKYFARNKHIYSDCFSQHRKILVLSQRRHETLGREAKSSKTEEEMSPLTKALLCDEADNMFEHATFIPSGHQEFARSQDNAVNLSQMDSRSSVSSAFMDRESSVISELTKTVRNLVVSCVEPLALVCMYSLSLLLRHFLLFWLFCIFAPSVRKQTKRDWRKKP